MTGLYAHKLPPRCQLTPAEEAQADAALLAMFKLRDLLVRRDANNAACRVDETMSALEDLARGRVDQ